MGLFDLEQILRRKEGNLSLVKTNETFLSGWEENMSLKKGLDDA